LLAAAPLRVQLAAPPALRRDHRRAELRPAEHLGGVLRSQHEHLRQRGRDLGPLHHVVADERQRVRPDAQLGGHPPHRGPLALRPMGADLRSQPPSAAANGSPVTLATYSAADGGFLLASACTIPRPSSSRATSTSAASAAGGCPADSR